MRRAVLTLIALLASTRISIAQPAPADPPPPALDPDVPAPPAAPDLPPPSPLPVVEPPPPPLPAPPGPNAPKLTKEQVDAIRNACEVQAPDCDPVALFGAYEQTALARALRERRLTVDRAPWGKRLRNIYVSSQDVFGPDDGPLTVFNLFHRTTTEGAIEREVLLRPGEVWKQSLIDETMRKLRDPAETVVAVAVPIETGMPGTVDLLVVNRDVWSIRLNSNYEVQSGKFTYLTVSLSENNLLGWRKLLALVFVMDQGEYQLGPTYIDHNVLGRQLTLTAHAGVIFNRETSRFEGSTSTIDFARPLWSLDSRWGAGVTWTHRYDIARSFLGTSLRTFDDPATPKDDAVPWEFREHNFSLTTSVVRQFPGELQQQVRVGHLLGLQRPSMLDEDAAAVAPDVRAAFERDVLPRSERSSQLFLSYTVFTPRYRAFHDIETFDLAEDLQLGPTATVTGGVGLHLIGSENSFARLTTSAGWTEALGADGNWHVGASSEHRFDDGAAIDNLFNASGRLVTPGFSFGRVVLSAELATRWHETQNRFLAAGGDSGLRGFIIGEFTGQRRAVGHVELRTLPVQIWFTRVGGIAFWDVGGAASSFETMRVHDDVGVGFRAVIPQTSPNPLRFDWAFALDGRHVGWPGRIIIGYQQAF